MSLYPEVTRGITGGGNGRYFFRYELSTYADARSEARRELEHLDFTPHVLERRPSRRYEAYDLLLYERIEGADLLNLPDDLRKQSYSNDFAKQLAQLFINLDRAGFTHNDAHAGNVMVQKGTNKLYMVDDEVIVLKPVTPPKIIDDHLAYKFAYTLLGTYLGESPFDLINELNRVGRLHTRVFSFTEQSTGGSIPQTEDTRQKEEVAALLEVLRERGIADKIDPDLLTFISDAFVVTTVPKNLDRVFALK